MPESAAGARQGTGVPRLQRAAGVGAWRWVNGKEGDVSVGFTDWAGLFFEVTWVLGQALGLADWGIPCSGSQASTMNSSSGWATATA